jgi:NAD-dependent deacetylase
LRDGNVTPNAAHRALAALEQKSAANFLLVTQNIDDLHECAGSRNLTHMHGELFKARCAACDRIHEWHDDIEVATRSPCCGATGKLRPHVVWFGEMPLEMDRIGAALSACDLFVSIGTSGSVNPAAGFVQEARRAGARTVELNLEPSEGHSLFAERRYGPATQVVPAFVERLLAGA